MSAMASSRAIPASTCTCGKAEPHIVSERRTTDDVYVAMWSDGAITGRMGFALDGVPVARPRTAQAASAAQSAGWMLMGEVSAYDADEIPSIYAACRWAASRGLDIVAVREHMHADAPVRFVWTVTATDRDGRQVEREAHLNRVQWPGLCVLHTARGYELMSVERRAACGVRSDEVLVPTGLVFSSQRALSAHLRGLL